MTTPTSSAIPDPHPNERARPLLEVAYLYEPYWNQHSSDWVKSLVLFFDGIALLVPDYMRDRPLFRDPALAQPLDDQGLLHRLSPDTLVDQTTTEGLTELLDDLLRAGAFDQLSSSDGFTELSYSRLGGLVDAGLTEVVLEQLRERGLAKPSEDGARSRSTPPYALSFSSCCHSCCVHLPRAPGTPSLRTTKGHDADQPLYAACRFQNSQPTRSTRGGGTSHISDLRFGRRAPDGALLVIGWRTWSQLSKRVQGLRRSCVLSCLRYVLSQVAHSPLRHLPPPPTRLFARGIPDVTLPV